MTITNVYIAGDRRSAVCVTDTLLAQDGATRSHASKYAILAHVPAVLLFRGSWLFGSLLGQRVTPASYSDFDALAAMMQAMCRRAATDHGQLVTPLDGTLSPEVVLVGRSSRAGGYAAVHYRHGEGFEPDEQDPGFRLAPGPYRYAMPARQIEPDDHDLILLAEAQMQRTRLDHGSDGPDRCGSGGDLIKIRLDRDGTISTRAIHRLGDFTGDPTRALAESRWYRSPSRRHG